MICKIQIYLKQKTMLVIRVIRANSYRPLAVFSSNGGRVAVPSVSNAMDVLPVPSDAVVERLNRRPSIV